MYLLVVHYFVTQIALVKIISNPGFEDIGVARIFSGYALFFSQKLMTFLVVLNVQVSLLN